MVNIEFLGPIKKEALQFDINNLNELSVALKQDADLSVWLESCAVAVNDVLVSSKDTVLKDGDRVSLLPPVCGG